MQEITTKSSNGWTYDYSESLKMRFAYRGMEVMTEDKVRYNENETKIIIRHKEIPLSVHIIKKLFDGEIVE